MADSESDPDNGSSATPYDGDSECVSDTDKQLMDDLRRLFKPYGCTKSTRGIETKLDLSWQELQGNMEEWRTAHPEVNMTVSRRCDSCNRTGIENEVVYCCQECDGQYDECEKCHLVSTHHHTDSFQRHDPDTLPGASTSNAPEDLEGCPTEPTKDSDIILYGMGRPTRACDSCGRAGIKNEVVYCCQECDSQYDECEKCHLVSTHHHTDSFQRHDPDPDARESGTDLILYGMGLRARHGMCGDAFDDEYEEDDFVGYLNLPIETAPTEFVKLFEWRDWHRRTNGKTAVYTDSIGAIILRLQDYHIVREPKQK